MSKRCEGVGAPLTNVSRDRLRSGRLPVRGDCSACGGRAEATREWTAKTHDRPRLTPTTPTRAQEDHDD